MANCLAAQRTIETVEISNCGLTNNFSASIKKIINGHAERRDEIVWVAGLRGEAPKGKNDKQGLGELILSGNNFSDQFVFDLLPMLNYDQYLRSVDLSKNDIKISGIKDLIGWLEHSRNVMNLDLRENPGYSAIFHKQVIHALARNIKRLKSERILLKRILRKKWISEELLSYYEEENIQNEQIEENEKAPETTVKKSPHKKRVKRIKNPIKNNEEAKILATERIEKPEFPEKKVENKEKTSNSRIFNEDCKGISYSEDLISSEGIF